MSDWVSICTPNDVVNGGSGVRFQLPISGDSRPESAFLVRFEDRFYAYLNRCGHVPVELDWPEGQFFDDESVKLICATHGASYSPQTGQCLGGPCEGRGLVRLDTQVVDGLVWARQPAV